MNNPDLNERVKSVRQEIGASLKKYNLKIGATINFPQYRILPDDVLLALKVLDKHGVQYNTAFQDAGENTK